MILVDTSVWIDYFNGRSTNHTETLDQLLSDDTVLIGDIILTEILQGFDKKRDFDLARNALDELECVQITHKSLAVKAASNFRYLRSKGITIRKTIDMLIATWCIENTIPLLHNDSDFDFIASKLPLAIYLCK